MKVREPFKCDHCGIQRSGDSNHWWLLKRGATPNGWPQIRIEPWHAVRAEYAGTQHACGVDCMMKIAAQLAAQIIVEELRNSRGPATAGAPEPTLSGLPPVQSETAPDAAGSTPAARSTNVSTPPERKDQ